jgi:HAD superfamily hydrolase (TIGR01450 family)
MPVDLSAYHAVLLDLDGTVYHEETPLPGAIELIRALQQRNRTFACLSNSTSSPLRLAERLARMGVVVEPDRIWTAAAAACEYVLAIARTDPAIAGRPVRVFNLATEAVAEMLDGQVTWVSTPGEPCDAVLVGTPASVFATDERQRTAMQLLRSGARLVGICADRVYPSPRGLEFGAGALSHMLAYASNVRPIFCGKPEAIFYRELCDRLGVNPAWCVLIGDNLEADIIGGRAQGMRTILTLTGVTRRRDLIHLPADQQPDLIVDDLTEIL